MSRPPTEPSQAAQSTQANETPLPRSTAELLAAGRSRREHTPRRTLATVTAASRDPLGILDEQNAGRLQELIPLRTERMSQSPFTFYRGTAAIMAADLAAEPHTGILVPSCGDAHISNFGFYASQQRTLVFDLNDFDEAAWAPWEWDLKRLLTSVVIAAQSTGRRERVIRDAVLRATRAYAAALRAATALAPHERYYTHFDAAAGTGDMDAKSRKVLDRAIKHAKKRTGDRATRKLTTRVDASDQSSGHGLLRFIERPPTMVQVRPELRALQLELVQRYLRTATADINLLMQHYTAVDAIRRVVGVGSVGTRCSLSLFQDGNGNALILQSKEAGQSVLEQYGGIEQPQELRELAKQRGQGGRVVAMQRVLQAVSDPFLGSLRYEGEDVGTLELYVRQFHDMKGGIDAEEIEDVPFADYALACAVTLARAHSQSPHAAEVSGYVGDGRRLGDAMLQWSYAYAERSRQDYEAFISRR